MEGILEKMGTGRVASVAHPKPVSANIHSGKKSGELTLLLLVEYLSSNTDYGTTHMKRNS